MRSGSEWTLCGASALFLDVSFALLSRVSLCALLDSYSLQLHVFLIPCVLEMLESALAWREGLKWFASLIGGSCSLL